MNRFAWFEMLKAKLTEQEGALAKYLEELGYVA